MKKTLLLAVAILLTALSTTLNAALVLSENFEYPIGNLIGNGGWVATSGTATEPIQIKNNPLTYPNYQPSAIGNAIEIGNFGVGTSEKVRTEFSNIDSGSGYYAMLINLSSVPNYTGTAGTYLASFNKGTGTAAGTDYGYLVAKEGSSTGKVQFGVSKASTSLTSATAKIEFTSQEFELNTTYLVVVKYELNNESSTIVSLWVNPAIESTTPAPLVNASYSGATTNINRLLIRQGATATTPAVVGTIDAIRVATTWADLFGTTPPPATPTITITPKTCVFGNVFGGESYTKTINVKGKDLKSDITVAIGTIIKEVLTPTGEVTASAATITKAQAEAEGGYDLVITLTPTDEYIYQETITLSADEATSVVVKPSWSAAIPIEVADLAALRAKQNELYFEWLVLKMTGEVVVSHSFKDASSKTWIYVEDATGGMTIQDGFGDLTHTYVAGDKIKGMVGGLQKSGGSIFFLPGKDFNAPISQGNTITPTAVTLAELAASGSLYEGRLVKVDGVSFTNAGAVFGTTPTGDLTTLAPISQLGTGANMRLFSGVDIIGTTIPTTADIVGVSTSGAGNLIAPRSLQDISILTALEQTEATTAMWSRNQILFIDNSTAEDISIFNLSGSKIHQANGVEGLQTIELATSGLYIVKLGNRAAKVLIQ